MNKVIGNAIQLRKAVFDYLKGVAGGKDANIYRIKQLIQTSPIDRLMAVALYHSISRDPNNKFESIIRLVDKKLTEYNPYPFQSERQESFSLAFSVNRLITLSKYRLPNEETTQTLLQHILIDELSDIDILTLLKLLEYRPIAYSKSFYKLVANILDLLQERLLRSPANASFIASVSLSISKSPFRLSAELRKAINQAIDRNIPFFTFPQITELSHQLREKSLQQWMQVGNLETSPIRKRVIYQYILNKQHPGLQYRSFLPGKQWKQAGELEEAVRCVRSLGVKESYIDIFPTIESAQFSNPASGLATLENAQFTNQFIEHVFSYIKNNYSRIDVYSHFKIVRTLRSLFSEGIAVQPSLDYFQKQFKKYNINLLSLMMVVYELGRYPVEEAAELQKITGEMLSILKTAASTEYLKQFPYKNYKTQELKLLFDFISCQIVDILASGKASQDDFFQKIDVLLLAQQQKKHEVNDYSKLLAFYRFAKMLSERKEAFEGTQADILLQQELLLTEIKEMLQPYLEISQPESEGLDASLERFLKRYKIVQNVLLQPNLQVKYAILSKDSAKIDSVFEYKMLVYDKLAYESSGSLIEQKVKIVQESKDLSLHGVWRKNFFAFLYKSEYFYCQDEMQLSYKLLKKVKQLGKQ